MVKILFKTIELYIKWLIYQPIRLYRWLMLKERISIEREKTKEFFKYPIKREQFIRALDKVSRNKYLKDGNKRFRKVHKID
jgi:hypothetical protein